jgi:hypothetical protein
MRSLICFVSLMPLMTVWITLFFMPLPKMAGPLKVPISLKRICSVFLRGLLSIFRTYHKYNFILLKIYFP